MSGRVRCARVDARAFACVVMTLTFLNGAFIRGDTTHKPTNLTCVMTRQGPNLVAEGGTGPAGKLLARIGLSFSVMVQKACLSDGRRLRPGPGFLATELRP